MKASVENSTRNQHKACVVFWWVGDVGSIPIVTTTERFRWSSRCILPLRLRRCKITVCFKEIWNNLQRLTLPRAFPQGFFFTYPFAALLPPFTWPQPKGQTRAVITRVQTRTVNCCTINPKNLRRYFRLSEWVSSSSVTTFAGNSGAKLGSRSTPGDPIWNTFALYWALSRGI